MRGTSLPGREPVELWTDHGRISRTPVPGARTIAGTGFVLPGLVDVHTHPGAPQPGQPLDEEVLRADLMAHRAAGVTAVRTAGAPARLPAWGRGGPGAAIGHLRRSVAEHTRAVLPPVGP
ncbi:MAG: hypothetical protein ACRDNF_07130 [Streptosporangiaceae bacterium]